MSEIVVLPEDAARTALDHEMEKGTYAIVACEVPSWRPGFRTGYTVERTNNEGKWYPVFPPVFEHDMWAVYRTFKECQRAAVDPASGEFTYRTSFWGQP